MVLMIESGMATHLGGVAVQPGRREIDALQLKLRVNNDRIIRDTVEEGLCLR